jgi:lysophospholipase L1-like esterase
MDNKDIRRTLPSRRSLLILVLLIGLGVSLLENLRLYQSGERYHRDIHSVRLDPLGLKAHPSSPPPTVQPGRQRTVVFFGDSRAAEWPAPAGWGDTQFVNRGIGAQTSIQVASRFAAHIVPVRPDVVVVQVGINDLRVIPFFPQEKAQLVDDCKANIQQIVADAGRIQATVILTTIFPIGPLPFEQRLFASDEVDTAIEDVNAYIRSLRSADVLVLDSAALLANERGRVREDYSRDALHLNAAGYGVLNQALADMLRSASR